MSLKLNSKWLARTVMIDISDELHEYTGWIMNGVKYRWGDKAPMEVVRNYANAYGSVEEIVECLLFDEDLPVSKFDLPRSPIIKFSADLDVVIDREKQRHPELKSLVPYAARVYNTMLVIDFEAPA